jgi:hypothetical protein
MSQATYSQFERGVLCPRPARLGQLASVLGVDVTVLAMLAGYPLEQILPAPMTG